MGQIALSGPSSAYFICASLVDENSGSFTTLYDAGQINHVIRNFGNCVNFSNPSKFAIVFDKIIPPTDTTTVDGIMAFKLINTDNNQTIVSTQVHFGFDGIGNFTSYLYPLSKEWTGSTAPEDVLGYYPTGTVYLINKSNNNILFFDFFMNKDVPNIISTAEIRGIGYYVIPSKSLLVGSNINCGNFSNNDNLKLEINAKTDAQGLNLIEISATVTADKKYPNGINDELIGYCQNLPKQNTDFIQTLYSFNPNLSKVLKLCGDNLLDQTNNINKEFNNVDITENEKNCQFFLNIVSYSAIRYYLGGLSSNGDFSLKWLYANNYHKFLRNLANSDFKDGIVIFTDPCYGFVDFNKYFRSCEHHH